jgi:4-hydroxybenzoate polyprenyltransferase/phosphoserine phosphatase
MSAATAWGSFAEPRRTIVVDLDGTLVNTDTFGSSLLEVLRKKPGEIWNLLGALVKGKSFCKLAAASLAPIDAASLPWNFPLLGYLRQRRDAGDRLILATGAASAVAQAVSEYLGIFDCVIATTAGRNIVSEEKARAVEEVIGTEPFTYAGNSRADLPIWRSCNSAIAVSLPSSQIRELQASGITVRRAFARAQPDWKELMRCMRPHQWAKNLLVFLAVLLSHQIANFAALWHSTIAFAALSLCASSLYIVNDLLDLQADRHHPVKRNRPLAAGSVSLSTGILLAGLSVVCAAGLAILLPISARALLAAYAGGSLAYSWLFKRMLFLDVIALASLYALRVFYGGGATGIHISVWTLAFSLFFFTALAALKRLAELRNTGPVHAAIQKYRGYVQEDAIPLIALATATGFTAILVVALYINSPEVTTLYRSPTVLWLLCPVLMYWIGRAMFIANRGEIDYDPVAFALCDRPTWIVAMVLALVMALSVFA